MGWNCGAPPHPLSIPIIPRMEQHVVMEVGGEIKGAKQL
jgi:hypothetical protein